MSAFRIGDLDLVWFGGLTGVQARLQAVGLRLEQGRRHRCRARVVTLLVDALSHWLRPDR